MKVKKYTATLLFIAGNFIALTVATAANQHGFTKGEIIEYSENPETLSVVESIPLPESFGKRTKVVEKSGTRRMGGGGADKDSGASKKTTQGASGIEFYKTEIRYILYASEYQALGKAVSNYFKENGDAFVVPISPLKRDVFLSAVQASRQTFLDKWWPNPERVSVVVVSPDQSSNGMLSSDEQAWPLTSLMERDEEIRKTFRGKIARPNWTLILPLPETQHCKLSVNELAGLSQRLPKQQNWMALEPFAVLLAWSAMSSDSERQSSGDPNPPGVYRCWSIPRSLSNTPIYEERAELGEGTPITGAGW